MLVTVALSAMSQNLALQIVGSSKQRQCATAIGIMRARCYLSFAQRQARLASFQRLALALLVATKHDRLLGRSQIQTNDVPKLLLELLVV